MSKYPYLNRIKNPEDLKKISEDELDLVCSEIRQKILEVVSKNGGHLASNLGVVELTVAIHKVFNSPKDRIIFDVGHQCYAHKLLTGRFNCFDGLRKKDGISGFTKPAESLHDPFISGHASTSLSIACGIAEAELQKKNSEKNFIVAVIGDGALTGGMAYEALNNMSDLSNLIIILNCNEMSISKTVGSFSKYYAQLRTHKAYIFLNDVFERTIKKIPVVGSKIFNLTLKIKQTIKKILFGSNIFSDLGFSFLSPINGHSVNKLIKSLKWAKQVKKPAIIQVFTKKGKGYFFAEQDPEKYHGVGEFNLKDGVVSSSVKTFSKAFGEEICSIAEENSKVCVITAAMEDGTELGGFNKKFPNRFFDVGIAEQHAVTFSAGLSVNGMIPIFAVYSTFLQRGFDQILHDVAIMNCHVVFAIDRAGIVGEDGETHQGIFDVSFLTLIPNLILFEPVNYFELKKLLRIAIFKTKGLIAIRYPKGKEDSILSNHETKNFNFEIFGESEIVVVTYGRLVYEALRAKSCLEKENGIEISVLKMTKLNPIEDELINALKQFKEIFFFEEGIRRGGICEHIVSKLAEINFKGFISLTAIENEFPKQATTSEMLEILGLDCNGIKNKIKEQLKQFNEKFANELNFS